jgi:hypothetical protein
LKIKTFIVAILVVVFSLTAVFAFAADPWFILKDKNGVCKIIQAADKTPATIAGPFKTKEAAEKVKDKACAAVPKSK